MAHVHPIHAACTPDRTVMHGEDHRVSLLQRNHGGTRLHTRTLFCEDELAAREIRYLWWVILLLALAIWLIWGLGRKQK